MVVRYALSLQARLRFSTSNTSTQKQHGKVKSQQQDIYTPPLDSNERDSKRKTSSWAAEAHLDIPIQLTYASDNDQRGKEVSETVIATSTVDDTLRSFSTDDELEAIRGVIVDLHERGDQCSQGTEGSTHSASSSRRTMSMQEPRPEEGEVLPTYGESIGMGNVLATRPVSIPYF